MPCNLRFPNSVESIRFFLDASLGTIGTTRFRGVIRAEETHRLLEPYVRGQAHDKKIADTEGITYPPEAILYKDTGFQGYNPAVKKTRQAIKRAAPRRAQRC